MQVDRDDPRSRLPTRSRRRRLVDPRRYREPESDNGPTAGCVCDSDASVVRPHDLVDNRQTETRTATAAFADGVQTDKALQDPRFIGIGNPRPVVGHGHTHVAPIGIDGYCEVQTVTGVTGRIVRDVPQDSSKFLTVALHPHSADLRGNRLAAKRFEACNLGADHFVEVNVGQPQRHSVLVGARQEQQVRDHSPVAEAPQAS